MICMYTCFLCLLGTAIRIMYICVSLSALRFLFFFRLVSISHHREGWELFAVACIFLESMMIILIRV